MTVNFGKELAALRRMLVDGLRARYAEVFGETTNGRLKDWLIKRIIYRLQVLAEGDLSERALRRAAELANDADLRRPPPKSPIRVVLFSQLLHCYRLVWQLSQWRSPLL